MDAKLMSVAFAIFVLAPITLAVAFFVVVGVMGLFCAGS